MGSGRCFKPSSVKAATLVMIGTLVSMSDTDGKKGCFPAPFTSEAILFQGFGDTSELVMPRMDFRIVTHLVRIIWAETALAGK